MKYFKHIAVSFALMSVAACVDVAMEGEGVVAEEAVQPPQTCPQKFKARRSKCITPCLFETEGQPGNALCPTDVPFPYNYLQWRKELCIYECQVQNSDPVYWCGGAYPK